MLASSATADHRGTEEVRDKKMRAPIPQEKQSVLWAEMIAFLEAQTSTDIANSLPWKAFWRACDDLAKDDALMASLFKAVLSSSASNLEDSEYWLRNVERLGGKSEANAWRMCLRGSQGYASRALEIAPKALANPGPISFVELATAACWIGAFTTVLQAVNIASQQNKVLVDVANVVEIARNADHVLSQLDVTEAHYAAILDVAGEMMRERKLAWTDTSSYHVIDEGPDQLGFLMVYRIHVTPEEASDMNFELASNLVDRDLDKPGLSVSFQGMKVH